MKQISLLALLTLTRLSAAPAITSVQNAASNMTVGLPNSSLAPGSIFVVKGSGLGPANISIAPAPFLSTSLSGTSVALTVAGTTVNALMYYTSDKQIAALLPSNTPTGGPATITVTYNGQTNPPTQFRDVAANNLAIFTLDSSGQGAAIVTYPDYSLVSGGKAPSCGAPLTACGAANPGDTLILWGTGLGAISGNDASGAGLGQNMPDIPLTLWLGGVQAPVVYQGRSGCCIGEDQIVFTVPGNVPTGCAVPLVAQIRGQISNSTVMPVANGSRNCTPSDPAFAPLLTKLLTETSFAFGDIFLEKRFANNTVTAYRDQASSDFVKITLEPGFGTFAGAFFDDPPLGTCVVRDDSNPGNEDYGFVGFAALNPGSRFTVSGPNGSVMVPSGDGATISEAGTFLGPGAFTVTGTGGADVGPWSATLTIPALPTLVSPASTVTRTDGMTITWTGGGGGTINLQVSAALDRSPDISATARCKVAASAGTFTIPPYVLLALPAAGRTGGNFGWASSVPFTATGIDVGSVHASFSLTAFGGFRLQ